MNFKVFLLNIVFSMISCLKHVYTFLGPTVIPDGNPTGVTIDVTFPGQFVNSLEIQLYLTIAYVGDVDIYVNGLNLCTNNGYYGDNFGTLS